MLKKVIAVALLSLASLAIAEPVILSDGHVPAELALKCSQSCIVMDRADWDTLQAKVNELAQRAFQAGVEAAKAKAKGSV